MNITLLKAVHIAGAVKAAGTTLDVDDAIGASLVHRGDATNNRPHTEPVLVMAERNPVTGGIEIQDLIGAGVVRDYAPDADFVTHPAPPTVTHLGPGGNAPFTVDKLFLQNDFTAANLLGFVPRAVSQWGTDYVENAINATWTPSRYAVEFDLIGSEMCLRYRARNTAPYFWIWVDGKPVSALDAVPSGISPSPGSLHRIRVQFSTAAVRRVRIYCELADYGGIECPAGSSVVATPQPREKLVIVGDSWSEGTVATTPFGTMSSRLGRRLSLVPYIAAQGGTGYTANGGGGQKGVFGSSARVAAVAAALPTRILIVGSINDRSASAAAVQSAAEACYAAYAAACPGAKIEVAGVQRTSNTVSGTDAAVNAAISAAAAAAGLPFFDLLDVPIGTAALATALVSDSHPTPIGADFFATRLSARILPVLQYRR